MALEVTDANLSELLEGNELTVLDFWAPWCGPCKTLGPIIDELHLDNIGTDKLAIGKVNVDENDKAAIKYGIRGIPTILFLRNNEVVERMTGLKTKDDIQTVINSLLS